MFATPTSNAAQLLLIACSLAFGALVLFSKLTAPAEAKGGQRAGVSRIGILLQTVGIGLAGVGPVRQGAFLDPVALASFTITGICGVGALLLFTSSRRALGKNWSLVARTREDHGLVTAGPYARVRHPIYTALLLFLLAVGAATGHPFQTLLALPLFLAGTSIRVRAEERLLSDRFGPAHRDYVRAVPAILPRFG